MVAAVKVRPSALFSAQKHRASKSKKSVISVAKAVVSVMRRELGEDAVARWRSLLDTELGESFFESLEDGKGATKPIRKPAAHMTTPTTWTPHKPKTVLLLLDTFRRADELSVKEGGETLITNVPVSIGTANRALAKLMAKRAVDWMALHRKDELRATAELAEDQLDDSLRLHRVLARVAADTLAYLHVAATAMRLGEDEVLLELQVAEQRVVGLSTKGCGIVFCAKGRALFERAMEQTIIRLTTCEKPAESEETDVE